MFIVKPFLIAISGPTAAGKTYFTKKLIEMINEINISVIRISTDEFYKDLSSISLGERTKVNYDLPNSINKEEFLSTLKYLSKGNIVKIPIYDFSTHTRKNEVREVNPADIIIVEGIFSLAFKEINDIYDLKIYIELDQDLRLIRRVRRDIEERGRTVESVFNQYLNQVRPAQDKYVVNDRNKSDIILLGDNKHHKILNILRLAIQKEIVSK